MLKVVLIFLVFIAIVSGIRMKNAHLKENSQRIWVIVKFNKESEEQISQSCMLKLLRGDM